ncbi:endonuclease/exonuclease/phosphatase family protein [Halogeometricum sp. S1BR25-6]|uniref:Endonuclease/exonuclease/phosphatase family protein n=1 Tax=Halogeometricum salsisoli TaxID=2950536 RepID=A0ABU2GAJ8_9EURY|nr:endonuclease/exonuclease/phosphatase family protein [Halogeometricum sp. S1BR25-6]MDS0297841.1 endonuclease/exonuclease/phosphatase family protein [Halogeometricum sp. S1BR25-6]
MTFRDHPAFSRRSALRVGAATGFGLAVPNAVVPAAARADDDGAATTELTVATRNLGLGANLFALFLVESMQGLARTVGDLYTDIERSAPTDRMRAIAGELARTRPDVVGVQEAALVRTDDAGDGGAGGPDAETVAFDFLADLTAALEVEDEPYEVAGVTTNADAEFPGLVDGDEIDVRLTDRDAVLVRAGADVEVTEASPATFEKALTVPLGDDRTFRVDRGYGVVDATVRGESLTVVNTHLESASESVRGAQAEELAAALESVDGPAILLGDLNDGPEFEGGAYETLAEGRIDAWASARDGDGDTCCRASTLDGPGSMDTRVDHVLVGGGLTPTDARLVGADAESRLTATVDGESRTLWPSDHAGVVASLRTEGTVAAAAGMGTQTAPADETTETTETAAGNDSDALETEGESGTDTPPTESADAATDTGAGGDDGSAGTDGPTTATDAPGFGPLAGLAGVLGGAAELVRRRSDRRE